jgi:signal transduction histidine kinase
VLLENAAEACADRGRVILAARVEGAALRLQVQDDGPGIPPHVRKRLFRAGATTKRAGHGYGLFLARRLVEARGGQLTAEPRGDIGTASGATFSVRLPMRAA